MKKKLFVLGDSISIHYGPYLEKIIKDKFLYERKKGMDEALQNLDKSTGANGGDSRNVLEYLTERRLKGLLNYDVIVLNCGLHDIKTNPGTGERQVPIIEYKENLTKIFKLVQDAGVYTFWVSSTPVDDERHKKMKNEFYRYDNDVIIYNNKASMLAKKFNIPVIDLYSFTKRLDGDIYCDHVHFVEGV
jgi:lysophospholipase L1-like esterase